jgi:hypothetical protein
MAELNANPNPADNVLYRGMLLLLIASGKRNDLLELECTIPARERDED